VELPRRTTAPRASEVGPDNRAERTTAAAPQTVGGRFDRGLRRVTRERTQLLSWLADSDQAGVLRDAGDIDLRDVPVIDVRETTAVSESQATESSEPTEVPADGSLFQR